MKLTIKTVLVEPEDEHDGYYYLERRIADSICLQFFDCDHNKTGDIHISPNRWEELKESIDTFIYGEIKNPKEIIRKQYVNNKPK